jgi:GAF domain-containing protein
MTSGWETVTDADSPIRDLEAELEAAQQLSDMIGDLSRLARETGDVSSAMRSFVEVIVQRLGYEHVAILLLDAELEELEVVAANGFGDIEGLRIPDSQGSSGYAVTQGEPVVIPDVTTDPRHVAGIRGGRSELVVPIVTEGTIGGVIDVESPILDAFDESDVRNLATIATYVSMAVENANRLSQLERITQTLKRRELEVRLLSTVNQALAPIEDPQRFFLEVLSQTSQILGWQRAAIWRFEPESARLVAEYAAKEAETRVGDRVNVGEGTVGAAAKTGEPTIALANKSRDEDDQPAPEMAVPLWEGSELSCVLHVSRPEPRFSGSDLGLLAAFGSQVSSSYTAMRLRQDTQEQITTLDDRTRRLDLLIRVSRSLTRRLALDELLDAILRLCVEAFELSVCAVLLLDGNKKSVLRKASVGYDPDAPTVLAVGEGITGHVAATGVPILVKDVTKDPRYVAGVSGSRSEMTVPLRVFGEMIGILDAESTEEGAFDEEDLDLFTCFAAQAAVAIHNADLTAKLKPESAGRRE